MAYEVIVIGEHRPGFEPPPELICNFQQLVMKKIQVLRISKEVKFLVRRRRDDVRAGTVDFVRRRVRPLAPDQVCRDESRQ